MKKAAIALVFIFCLLLAGTCSAFTQAPVAVLVMGDTYASFDSELVGAWQERVKRRFRFPDYQVMSQQEIKRGLDGQLPAPDAKSPYFKKEQLSDIADKLAAEIVFVFWVNRLEDRIYQSWSPFGDTIRRVYVSIDVTAYRKTDDRYFTDRIRYSQADNIAISAPAKNVATDKIADSVNKFKEQLPKLEKALAEDIR